MIPGKDRIFYVGERIGIHCEVCGKYMLSKVISPTGETKNMKCRECNKKEKYS